MTDDGATTQLTAEQRARLMIDAQLKAAGWQVQSSNGINLSAGSGIALREKVMAPGHGRADYILFVDKKVVGVIEAKPEGTTLSGVEWQSSMYANGLPEGFKKRAVLYRGKLPFVFEASGTETKFTNGFDPNPRSRDLFNFPKPETLSRFVRDYESNEDAPTWRAKVRTLPTLDETNLRPAQGPAIINTERSLAQQKFNRSLIQMATGAGKTYTAITLAYRLLKWGGFNRILLLVDRTFLGTQALAEFQNFTTPDDGRKFTDLYNVDILTRAGMSSSSKVVISTIQRVYAALRGNTIPGADDPELDDWVPDSPPTITYNPNFPPEAFDLIIVDEAHRSIYGTWRPVLDYFDAHVIGLTATPGKQTFAFFKQNLVSSYTYPESVADGVNVDFDIYRIKTKITEQGETIEAGSFVPILDKKTRAKRIEELNDDVTYTKKELDRSVTNPNQIRLVLETFRDRLGTEIFPGRSVVPKTLIYAKDDDHAEQIVTIVREVFGKGNEFAAKITYKADDPKKQLQALRTSPKLRIAVTVDMIATGTDIKPLECVFFMRDTKNAQYFEQMRGRGSRTIDNATFQAVTPDAKEKTRFVLVDAVGVTEHAFVEPPLNRNKSLTLQQLLQRTAFLTITESEAATLASRLAALERQITSAERTELEEIAGQPLRNIIRGLVDAVDPDKQDFQIKTAGLDPETQPKQVGNLLEELVIDAVQPLATNPELRQRLLEIRRSHDQIIDELNPDELLEAKGIIAPDRAKAVVSNWVDYVYTHRDEITAIQLMDEAKRYGSSSHIPFGAIRELSDRIQRPPYNLTTDLLWAAYEQVEAGKVKHRDKRRLTDLISLLRFTLGDDAVLVPFAQTVDERYAAWLTAQEQRGIKFTDSQRWWLDRIAEVIANSASVTADDLEATPFDERGGIDGALVAFSNQDVAALLEQLNQALAA